jgi:hypothetical protein
MNPEVDLNIFHFNQSALKVFPQHSRVSKGPIVGIHIIDARDKTLIIGVTQSIDRIRSADKVDGEVFKILGMGFHELLIKAIL